MGARKYYAALILTTIIWGATPACGKLVVGAMSPLMITGLRFACMALLLIAFLAVTGQLKSLRTDRHNFKIMVLLGLMGVLVHNGLLFLGLTYTTATNTALIESCGPTITTVLAFVFIGEHLTKSGWLGILISCLGAVLIVTKGSLEILLTLSFNLGDIIVLFAEAAWSVYAIIGTRLKGKTHPLAVTAYMAAIGSLSCFLAGGLSGTLHMGSLNPAILASFSYLVVFSGIVAFVMWNWAVSGVGASKAGAFVYLVPLTGAVIGVVFLDDPIALGQIAGGLLIVFGMVITMKAKVSYKDSISPNRPQTDDLLKRFPSLAEEHNMKLKKMQKEEEQRKNAAANFVQDKRIEENLPIGMGL